MYEGKRCRNCGALLLGPFCHECGQQHFEKHLTTGDYMREVAQRVYRFDGRFLRTIRGCVIWPGGVVNDYLDGRRSRIVDPLQYFAACVFVQFVLAWSLRKLAVMTGQDSVLNWQPHFSGFVAGRFLFIFWFGSLWYLMFPRGRRTLSEIYVFATYAFPTVGLLWTVLPFLDLLLPVDLGFSRGFVIWIKFAIELCYFIFAIHTFGRLQLWNIALRCILVLGTGNALLLFIMSKPWE
ncbi:MAG TPA: DUF3667 domain-containing protein [Steroidobacteraceae bacterium]|nr:DUF3667 domain-containing protein [Steroidobacteraceae bacterium]